MLSIKAIRMPPLELFVTPDPPRTPPPPPRRARPHARPRDRVFKTPIFSHPPPPPTRHKLNDYLIAASANVATRKVDFYREFLSQLDHFFEIPGQKLSPR